MESAAYPIPLITTDTTPESSVMIGENKILLRAFGLMHRQTFQPFPEKICDKGTILFCYIVTSSSCEIECKNIFA